MVYIVFSCAYKHYVHRALSSYALFLVLRSIPIKGASSFGCALNNLYSSDAVSTLLLLYSFDGGADLFS
jgi:hypothetical protein